ncbi:MAG: hypothetical protein ACREHD_01315, partial [Pirellulales bacterium]
CSMKTKLLAAMAMVLLIASEASAYRRGRGGYGYNPMAGMASLITAPAKAAVSYQQAYQLYIQNHKLAVQTYFDLRRMNASYRAEQEMLHPHATPEEIAAFNQARQPPPLSGNEFDPGHGVIDWPPLLQRSEFDDYRHQLEGHFSEWASDPHAAGLGTQNCRDIQHVVADMSDKLHSEIKQFQPDEYIAATKFLRSLAFEARSAPGNTVASK